VSESTLRYTTLAVALHWTIAAAVIANIALGVWMHEAIEVASTSGLAIQAYQIHKSLGLTVLALTLVRVAWRLTHKPPSPPQMKRWQALSASLVHKAFYVLMIALPLTGWLLVSTQWRGDSALNIDTVLFNRLSIPHLFDLHMQTDVVRQQTAETMATAHKLLGISMGVLVIMHIGAALVHQFRDRDQLVLRMGFSLRHRNFSRLIAGWAGLLATFVFLTSGSVYIYSALQAGGDATPDQSTEQISAAPGSWQVLPGSTISFSGAHAGNQFTGRFLRWQIDAHLDSDDLSANPRGAVVVDTASAYLGNDMWDRALPEAEWFDVANYPIARFDLIDIRPDASGGYVATGDLQIKDRRVRIEGLTLTVHNDTVYIGGDLTIERADIDMGMESDPAGDWVSPLIHVTIDVTLRP
jgi:cytochrome b561